MNTASVFKKFNFIDAQPFKGISSISRVTFNRLLSTGSAGRNWSPLKLKTDDTRFQLPGKPCKIRNLFNSYKIKDDMMMRWKRRRSQYRIYRETIKKNKDIRQVFKLPERRSGEMTKIDAEPIPVISPFTAKNAEEKWTGIMRNG